MDYKFIEPVHLYCGGARMRALRPGEAKKLLALGSVIRPQRRRVYRLDIKSPGRKSLPGIFRHSKNTYRERLPESGARLLQHRGMRLSG